LSDSVALVKMMSCLGSDQAATCFDRCRRPASQPKPWVTRGIAESSVNTVHRLQHARSTGVVELLSM
jgi:hypothetical protein